MSGRGPGNGQLLPEFYETRLGERVQELAERSFGHGDLPLYARGGLGRRPLAGYFNCVSGSAILGKSRRYLVRTESGDPRRDMLDEGRPMLSMAFKVWRRRR
jgi:hypothetical protein